MVEEASLIHPRLTEIFKAKKLDLNPLDDGDFIKLLSRLAVKLRKETERKEALSLRDFIDSLDVDWSKMTLKEMDRVTDAAMAVYRGSVEGIIPKTSKVFKEAARVVIPATKVAVIDKHNLDIKPGLSDADKATGAALIRQQGPFIKEELAARAQSAAARARTIVLRGLDLGLGRDAIATNLATDVVLSQLARSKSYWEVSATAFLNRARTSTQLNSFEEAGIRRYRFVAVLDQRTTDICRFMDGRVFNVSDALDVQRKAEALDDPDEIRDLQPWVYQGSEGGRPILYYEKKGERRRVAYIDASGVGAKDERGLFSEALDAAALRKAGILVPPLHPKCRSTIVMEAG